MMAISAGMRMRVRGPGRRLGALLATAPALLLLACNGSAEEPGAPSSSATGAGSVSAAPAPTTAVTATATAAPKPADVTGTPAPITWPALPASAATVRAALPKVAQERISESQIPALVPAEKDLLHAGEVVVSPSFYAFSAAAGGVAMSLHGTNVAYDHPQIKAAAGATPLRGTKGFVSSTEGTRYATWVENGVAYSVDVECEKAEDDRCTKDAYVVKLVDGLVYVGGAKAGGQARDPGTREQDKPPPRDRRPTPPGGP